MRVESEEWWGWVKTRLLTTQAAHEARLRAELEEALEEVAEAGAACSAHYFAEGRPCGALTAALVAANGRLEAAQKALQRWGY
jgi:hypothetical protein